MVVTNFEPEYGENDPIGLDFRPNCGTSDLVIDQRAHEVCYPVDGDMLNRQRAQEQNIRAMDASMTLLPPVPWAQHMLDIDRLGATGQWVQGAVYLGRPICEWQRWHAYRRWAEL